MDCLVNTKYGTVKGYVSEGICRFHGIPYAKPPVGDLRFSMPVPPDRSDRILEVMSRTPVAPQGTSDLDLPMGPVTQPWNEDCLTLSVSTPDLSGHLPVAVWFHGGANCYGGGDLEWYDGALLARRGHLVVVNLNFRLGALGFLHCPGINSRNLCIEDQLLALRWVQENITFFGGDPQLVTLFGQSAGANSIAHILSRPDSDGLFRQIVLQSASLGRGNHTMADAFRIGKAFLRVLSIDPEDPSALWKLRRKSALEILNAGASLPGNLLRKHEGMVFKPVMDSWHTPEETVNAAAKEAVRRGIRILMGTTRDEMHAFILQRDPESLETAGKLQRQRYDIPDREFALAASDGGCMVWKYRFDWQAPDSVFDSCHCLELPFLFGNLDSWNAPMLAGADMEEMKKLREIIQSLWCSFFRFESFDPEVWPVFTRETRLVKHLTSGICPVSEEQE